MFVLPIATSEELEGGNVSLESVGEAESVSYATSGRGYLSLLLGGLRLIDLTQKLEGDADEKGSEAEDKANSAKFAAAARKKTNAMLSRDPYELLGLDTQRWRASEADLKNAYHAAALLAHPDKNGGDDSHFKAVKAAWETLNTIKKRRLFDSTDPSFDDSIPNASDELAPEVFFSTFGPAFQNNRYWSVVQPVPVSLGDMGTPFEQVEKFYSWWRVNFRSWRDFSSLGEYDLEEAQSRDEKRWMEKMNKKAASAKTLEESTRISKLVENAYLADPRVAESFRLAKKQRAEARQAQQAAVRARRQEEHQRMAAAAAERRAEEAVKEAERLAQVAVLQQQRAALEEKRQELRLLAMRFPHETEQLESTCMRLGMQEITQLVAEMEGAADRGAAALKRVASGFQQSDRQERELRQQKQAAEAAGDKDKWTPDELSQLAGLLKKYPGGYPNRWDKIAEFMNSKTKRQIIAKTKALQDERPDEVVKSSADEATKAAWERFQATKKTAKQEITAGVSYSQDAYDVMLQQEANSRKGPWTFQEQEQFEQGVKEVPSDSVDRWDLIAKFVPSRSVPQIQQRYRLMWLVVNKPAQAEQILAKRRAQFSSESASSSGC